MLPLTLLVEALAMASEKKKGVEERKKEKKKAKIAKEKLDMTQGFSEVMANCGLWMEDEHVLDPDEVHEGDLDGS